MIPGFNPLMLLTGLSAGVVPGAVVWDDLIETDVGYGSNNAETIIVGEPILLRVELSSVVEIGDLSGSALIVVVDGVNVASEGIADSVAMDFTVSNGVSVYYSGQSYGTVSWGVTATATIKYKSAGSPTFDQTLDTFDIDLSGNNF